MSEPKKSDMLPGFNHNIKHHGRIYHVQTEDSGIKNPHIITHLFVGGNILATKKTSYADIVHAENFHQVVRELMEEQHKAMLRNLVNGVYDDLETSSAEPTIPASPMVHPQVPPQTAQIANRWGPNAPPKTTQVAAQPPSSRVEAGKRTQPAIPMHAAPTQAAMPAASSKKPTPGPQVYKPPPPELIPKTEPKSGSEVVLKSSTGQPRAKEAFNQAKLPPEVLAARRMADRPMPKDTSGPTIFGEDLISERSLDEVILGYLAGDGDENG